MLSGSWGNEFGVQEGFSEDGRYKIEIQSYYYLDNFLKLQDRMRLFREYFKQKKLEI